MRTFVESSPLIGIGSDVMFGGLPISVLRL